MWIFGILLANPKSLFCLCLLFNPDEKFCSISFLIFSFFFFFGAKKGNEAEENPNPLNDSFSLHNSDVWASFVVAVTCLSVNEMKIGLFD